MSLGLSPALGKADRLYGLMRVARFRELATMLVSPHRLPACCAMSAGKSGIASC